MSLHDLSDLLGSDAIVSLVSPSVVTPPGASAVASGGVSHDGSKITDNLALWSPPLRSADADILPEKGTLDARSRNLALNDSYIASGVDFTRDSIVGAQYRLSPQPETKVLWGAEDEKWESEYQEEVSIKFSLWAESRRKWADASRRQTLTGLVRLAMSQYMMTGEVLATGEWFDPARFNRPYGSCIQMIDPDRLSDPGLNYDRSRRIRRGVERTSSGMPIAYWIRNGHPSDLRFADPDLSRAMTWTRVAREKPWGRPMVLHAFDQDRADQSRAVSPLAVALQEMRMLKHFRITELQRAVIASTYAASLESEFPTDIATIMGSNVEDSDYFQAYMGKIAEWMAAANGIHMDGAKIPTFPTGVKLKIQNPGAESPMGDKFEQSALRNIAAALNMSYEELSRDYTQTNYSSARAAFGQTQKSLSVKKAMIADETANFVYWLWLEEAINNNEIEALKRRNVPNFYDRQNAEAYTKCEWIGAGQGQIDPLKETQAALLRVTSGFSTKETEIAKLSGQDYRVVARQIKRERELDAYYGNPSVYDQNSQDMQNSLSATPRDGGNA